MHIHKERLVKCDECEHIFPLEDYERDELGVVSIECPECGGIDDLLTQDGFEVVIKDPQEV